MTNKLWIAALLAAMLMVACTQPEPVVVVVTATPTPEERVDELARNVASPTPSPVAIAPTPMPIRAPSPTETPTTVPTNPPTPVPTDAPAPTNTPTPVPTNTLTPVPTSTPAPTNTPTPLPTDTPVPTQTPTPVPTSTPAPTNTPTPLPTDTPVPTQTPTPRPTDTPIPTSTPTPIPTNTPTPAPTSTPTPTNTPVPSVRLVLDAESTVVGYWSDGTVDVEVTATLRNEGALKLDRAQDITATCIAEDDERRKCREKLSLSLPDGFAPASESFTLRLPMGATALNFDYGEDAPLTLEMDVPERILGIGRDVWECYIDGRRGSIVGYLDDHSTCGGWYSNTVEKWLNDVPVKVWATGDPDHIAVLETVLVELAPILNLEFKWVGAEQDADFKAYVGVSRSEADSFGVRDPNSESIHAWGFAGTNVGGSGEATGGGVVIWDIDLSWHASRTTSTRDVTIHEVLHALAPMRHPSRPASIMGVAGARTWSPMDEALLRLNSHPLVRPGMSMGEVRKVVILYDELLDYQELKQTDRVPPALGLVWRAYVALAEGFASFHLSGGWIDRGCDLTFGVRRGPIEVSFGDLSHWADDPSIIKLDFQTDRFYIVHSEDDGWLHWRLSPEGAWELVPRETVDSANDYWLWNGKLHRAIRSVIIDASPEDIHVDKIDGNIHLYVTLDKSYIHYQKWEDHPIDKQLDLTLVFDRATLALVGYTWELHRDPEEYPGECLTYREVATDGRFSSDIEVPESIRKELD